MDDRVLYFCSGFFAGALITYLLVEPATKRRKTRRRLYFL